MSIQSEITRITGAKSDIADAIETKGVTVPEGSAIDNMAELILQIKSTFSTQAKTATPTESAQTIVPDNGYDGLSSVSVGAISSTYVGSQIDRNDSTDLTVSGATVTVPSGYYAQNASKTIASGSASTPTTSITATPSVSVDSAGLVTASVSASQSVTPTVNAGYVSSGTAGTVSVSGSGNLQLTAKAAQTYTPGTTDQTIASGQYLTGAQTIKGDVNLVSENIKSGVEIFGVTGTHSGSSVEVAKKQVKFFDYDGAIAYEYTADEALRLTSLPPNPSHEKLIAQGWNWPLDKIQEYLTDYPESIVCVGQMYDTITGSTEIDIKLGTSLKPYLVLSCVGTITIDWGDGSSSTLSGTSYSTLLYTQHIYGSAGSYTISISGPHALTCKGSSYPGLLMVSDSSTSTTYSLSIIRVRVGSDCDKIRSYAFNKAYCSTITLPASLTTLEGDYQFGYNNYISCIIIPTGITSIPGTNTFSNDRSFKTLCLPYGLTTFSARMGNGDSSFKSCLTNITIPSSVTLIAENALAYCNNIKEITIPANITTTNRYVCYQDHGLRTVSVGSYNTYMFSNCFNLEEVYFYGEPTEIPANFFVACHALQHLTIPNSVTNIGSSAFGYCFSLQSITIPSSVTKIGSNAFEYCTVLKEIHMLPETPPTAGSNLFSNCNSSNAIIYVPRGCLTVYKTATYWKDTSIPIQEEPE